MTSSGCPRPESPRLQDAADEDLPRAGGGSRRGQTGLGGGDVAMAMDPRWWFMVELNYGLWYLEL